MSKVDLSGSQGSPIGQMALEHDSAQTGKMPDQNFGIHRGGVPVAERSSVTFDEVCAGIMDVSKLEDKKKLFRMAAMNLPPEHRASALESLLPESEEMKAELAKLDEGFFHAADLPPGKDPKRWWFGLYPGTVALLNGETASGKSVILLSIALYAVLNKPLWGIPFEAGRPLRVLYLDAENSGNWNEGDGGITAQRLERLGLGRPEGLMFHSGKSLDLSKPAHLKYLRDKIAETEADIVILDPIVELFGTKDENDNMEAAKQMKAIHQLSRETGACIILCHHTGKYSEDAAGKPWMGRGASARPSSADAVIHLTAKRKGDLNDEDGADAAERNDLICVRIAKNRAGSRLTAIYLRMAGNLQFERVTKAIYDNEGPKGPSEADKMVSATEAVESMLIAGKEHSGKDILAAAKDAGISESIMKDVLPLLVSEEVILRDYRQPGGHFYRHKPGASFEVFKDSIRAGKTSKSGKGSKLKGSKLPEASVSTQKGSSAASQEADENAQTEEAYVVE